MRADVSSVVQESGIVFGTATCGPDGTVVVVVVVTGTDATVVVVVGATVVVAAGATVVVGATVAKVANSAGRVVEVLVIAGTEVVVVGSDSSLTVELVAAFAASVTGWVDVTALEEVGTVTGADAVVGGSTAVGLVVTDVDVETAAFNMPTA